MITLAHVCLLASLSPNSHAASTAVPMVAATHVEVSAVVVPQGTRKPTSPPPGGGTPEPTILLLMAGGALVYGGVRLRNRRKQSAPKES